MLTEVVIACPPEYLQVLVGTIIPFTFYRYDRHLICKIVIFTLNLIAYFFRTCDWHIAKLLLKD